QIKQAIKEMMRVCKNEKNMFIQVDAYRTEDERKTIENFNLTAKTILSVDEWLKLFEEIEYKGNYYWTIFDREIDE
ncbi:MAG: hypothetical protein ABIA56_00945, partial [Actinomycetota bacterium]